LSLRQGTPTCFRGSRPDLIHPINSLCRVQHSPRNLFLSLPVITASFFVPPHSPGFLCSFSAFLYLKVPIWTFVFMLSHHVLGHLPWPFVFATPGVPNLSSDHVPIGRLPLQNLFPFFLSQYHFQAIRFYLPSSLSHLSCGILLFLFLLLICLCVFISLQPLPFTP